MAGPVVTEVEKTEIWDRRCRGESLCAIARHLGRAVETIRRYVLVTGGVRPRPRTRSRCELTMWEREEISRGLAAEHSCHAIARRIRRAPSSVSREVARNGGRVGYRAAEAEQAALRRSRRPKLTKLARCPLLQAEVEARLSLRWSPQQISAFLKLEYAQDPEMQISHETIYLSLFVQSRGALRKELARYLRTRRLMRQPRTQLPNGRGQIPDRIMISERPADVADRAVPGHWEGDLMMGTATNGIGTLVERSTRYAMLFALPWPDRRTGQRGPRQNSPEAPHQPAPLADLGPRTGDGRPCPLHRRYRLGNLFLRPTKSVAARQQREHQRTPPPILS